MASDNDNTESLNLNADQALSTINAVIKQAKVLSDALAKVGQVGSGEPMTVKVLMASLKSLQSTVNGFGASLTSVDQKMSSMVQRTTRSVVQSGNAIAVQARQMENAAKLVQNALKAGFGSGGVANIKTSVDAIAAYEAGLSRIQTLLAKIESRGAFAGRTAGQKQLLSDLAEEQKLTAALAVTKDKLIAEEKALGAEQKKTAADARIAAKEAQRDADLTFRARQSARRADERDAAAAAKRQQLAINGPAPRNAESLGAKFVRNATTFANYALIGSSFAAGGAIASEVIKLDVALHNLQGITQTTDAGMVVLRQRILEVASGSRFMASEVADAATVLGQAGLSTDQISKSLGAVTVFAQAAGIKLEESVNLLTSAMGAFNLRADESMDIANTFTAALNNSKLTVEQLSAGFQYSASVAAQTGISYKELATTMALMAQAGIKSGSMIGSGIRQILNQLSSPSTKFKQILVDLGVSMDDVDLRSHGLIQVMKTLKGAGFDAGEAFKAFGTRGAGAFIALEGQLGSANTMRDSLTGTDAALKAASIQMESFGNTAKRFGSTVAAVASNGFQPLLQAMQAILSVGANFIQWVGQASGVVSVLLTALSVFATIEAGKYILALSGLTNGIRLFALSLTSVEGVLGIVAGLFSPMVLTIAAVTAAIVGITYAWNAHKIAIQANLEALDKANAEYATAHQKTEQLATATEDLLRKHNDLKSGTPELTTRMGELGEQFRKLGLDTTQLNNNYDQLLAKMRELRGVAALQETNALIDAQSKNVAVYKDQQNATDQAQFNLFRTPGFNLDRSLSSQYAAAGLNVAPVASALNRFGRLGAARPTAADIPGLYAAAASADSQNSAGLNASQKTLLKELHDAILKLADAANTENKTKGNIDFQGSAIQGLKLRTSGQIGSFTTQVENTEQAIRDAKPKDDGIDPVAYSQAINKWVNDARAKIKTLYDATVSFGKTDQSHQLAISDVQQSLKNFGAYLSTTDSSADTGAKALREQLAGYAQKSIETMLEAAKADQSNATDEVSLKKAHERVRSYTIQLMSSEADKVAAQLGLRSTDYNTSGGTINVTGGRLTAYNKAAIGNFNAEIGQKLHIDDQEYVAKRRSIVNGLDRGTTGGDNRAAAAAVRTLNEQLAKYISDAAGEFKNLDKYSPTGIVREHAENAKKDIEAWYALQVQKINEKAQQDIKNLPSKDTARDEHTAEIKDQAAQQLADLVKNRDDKLDDIRDKVKDLLNEKTDRLPQNMGEAWENIRSAAADPRKTKYSYDQFATTFQDVMISAVDKVKNSFGSMWDSILTGTESAGKAFATFGRGILQSMLSVITNKITQQFLDLVMGGSGTGQGNSLGGIGGFFSSIFKSLGGGSTGGAAASADSGMFFGSQGGLVRRAQGGSVGIVQGPIRTRDSVVAAVPRGSYVLRQSATAKLPRFAQGGHVMAGLMPGEAVFDPAAVASIGLDNLQSLNSGRGLLRRSVGGMVDGTGGMMNADPLGGRLQGAATKLNPKTQPHQTNVWVVKPDQQPPMTKNDVIVAVTDDMLKNGQTKQMIKSIMHGA